MCAIYFRFKRIMYVFKVTIFLMLSAKSYQEISFVRSHETDKDIPSENESADVDVDRQSSKPGFAVWPAFGSSFLGSPDVDFWDGAAEECDPEVNGCSQLCLVVDENLNVCDCYHGYVLLADAKTCRDIDECTTGFCGSHGECSNTDGSYVCTCHQGYTPVLQRDRRIVCIDEDECVTLSPCPESQTCSNSEGSYMCLETSTTSRDMTTPPVTQGNGADLNNEIAFGINFTMGVQDSMPLDMVDEGNGTDYFADNVTVSETMFNENTFTRDNVHTLASLTSKESLPGFVNASTYCNPKTCNCSQTCDHMNDDVNRCGCFTGYQLLEDRCTCADIDECDTSGYGCSEHAHCSNLPGSYRCQCREGFNGNGFFCFDVDECVYFNGGCSHKCINADGGYHCECEPGHNLTTDARGCADIDECDFENGGCDQACANTVGSFTCTCFAGFQLHADRHTCVDINECVLANGGCQATCRNTEGAFECVCPGHLRLGINNRTCEAPNSCSVQNGGCDHLCLWFHDDTPLCGCRRGYHLQEDARTCADNDECQVVNGGCEQTCQNSPGSYKCTCIAGYRLTDTRFGCQATCNPPCLNNGACKGPNQCRCPAGYPGPGCSPICLPHCGHGGTCTRWNKCNCRKGYTGDSCQIAICNPLCQNGARCIAPGRCRCTSGFSGFRCQIPICIPACLNGGLCTRDQVCLCKAGFTGITCEQQVAAAIDSACPTNYCLNGGTCVRRASGRGVCNCLHGYRGQRCQIGVPFDAASRGIRRQQQQHDCRPPCLNGGTCLTDNRCACPNGTTGSLCQHTTCRVVTYTTLRTVRRRMPVKAAVQIPCGRFGWNRCTKYKFVQRLVEQKRVQLAYKRQC